MEKYNSDRKFFNQVEDLKIKTIKKNKKEKNLKNILIVL